MKKKWISLALTVLLASSLAACQIKPGETTATESTEAFADVSFGNVPTDSSATIASITTHAETSVTTPNEIADIGVPSRTVKQYRAGISFQLPEDWEMVGSTALSTLYTDPTHNYYLSVADMTDMNNPFYSQGMSYTDFFTNSTMIEADGDRMISSFLMEVDGKVRIANWASEGGYPETLPTYIHPTDYKTNFFEYGCSTFLTLEYKVDAGASQTETYQSLVFLFPGFETSSTLYAFSFTAKDGNLAPIYEMADDIVQSANKIDPSEYTLEGLPTSTHTVIVANTGTEYFSFSYPANMTTVDNMCMGATRIADDTGNSESLFDEVAILVVGDHGLGMQKLESVQGGVGYSGLMAQNGQDPEGYDIFGYPMYTISFAGTRSITSTNGIALETSVFSLKPDFYDLSNYNTPDKERVYRSMYNALYCDLIVYTAPDGQVFGIAVIGPSNSDLLQNQITDMIINSITPVS